MARRQRLYSVTGIYHIVLKGVDKKWIFKDEQDKKVFLKKLFDYEKEGGYEVMAYCLMDNHVHLIMKEGERLGTSVQRFTVSYVAYYHRKYGTSGYFFGSRFHSDPIENDGYFLSALRYVHQNPVRAGMVSGCEAYHWSSYNRILQGYSGAYKSEQIYELIKTAKFFEEFHLSKDDWFSEDQKKRNRQRMDALVQVKNIESADISKAIRKQLIKEITCELSIEGPEIAAYFGVDRRTVYRALR